MNENENYTRVQIVDPRRPKMHISGWGINHFRRTNPWMTAWLSATTPGFGHIHLGMYAKGLACISLEIIS